MRERGEDDGCLRTRTNNQSSAIRAKEDGNPFLQVPVRHTSEFGKGEGEDGDDEAVEVCISEDGEVDDDDDEPLGGSEAMPFGYRLAFGLLHHLEVKKNLHN